MAAIGWLINDKLAIGRERRFKRGEFRSHIKHLRNRIESKSLIEIGGASPEEFTTQVKAMPEFEKAAVAVDQHIRRKHRRAFDEALSSYKGVVWVSIGYYQQADEAKAKMLAALEKLSNSAK